jgi:hypothetical protein
MLTSSILLGLFGWFLHDISHRSRVTWPGDYYFYMLFLFVIVPAASTTNWLFGARPDVSPSTDGHDRVRVLLAYGSLIFGLLLLGTASLRHARPLKQAAAGALIAWAILVTFAREYAEVYSHDATSFRAGGAGLTAEDFFYFSLVTFTTTGYGDISPASSPARHIVTLQLLASFLFLTFYVGLLASRLSRVGDDRPEVGPTCSERLARGHWIDRVIEALSGGMIGLGYLTATAICLISFRT